MPKNPRDPKAVRKLIADAQERQVERGMLAWLRRLREADKARRDTNGDGTGTRKKNR